MAQSYTRQSTFSDGDTITAALFNNEYNQLLNAFAYSSSSATNTGHRHDGSAGQGGNVPQIGDLDFLNKRAIFVYLRELSGLNAKQLSIAMSNIRKYYREIVKSKEKYFIFKDAEFL